MLYACGWPTAHRLHIALLCLLGILLLLLLQRGNQFADMLIRAAHL
jgi:hypothetical protein